MSAIISRPILIPVKELAKKYHMSERTIYDHIKQDPEFPFLNVGVKKKYLVDIEQFEVWMLKRTQREKRGILGSVPSFNELIGGKRVSI